nr:zinc finger, CCHC-type [Tanacetum cinerariifolium]
MTPAPNPETADPDTIDRYYESVNVEQKVTCLMLSSMSLDLQRTLENLNAYDMLKELKIMFKEQAKQELFETVKAFHACKHEDVQSVNSYLLKMKSYLDTLKCLGFDMPNELCVTLILNFLNKKYDQFIQNYNMHSTWKTIDELHAMLKLHEKGIPKKAETHVETMRYYFYNPYENKIFVARYAEYFKNSLNLQEASGSHRLLEASRSDVGPELIQEDDIQPSDDTIEQHHEVEPNEVEPHSMEVPVHRSGRISQAPDRYGIYVDAEEHELGDLNEPLNYKVALSDPEYDKWLDAMNTEMSKWLFKKKIDMDGNVHTFKPRLVAKDKDDTKSQTKYVFILNGGAVDWKSAMQSTTAMSSTEAEYITAAKASMEFVWIRKFIDGLGGVVPSNERPMETLCDNEPAIAITNDPRILKGTKHF